MSQKKRNLLTLKQKHKMLCRLDAGVKPVDMAKEFKVNRSVISNVKKDKEKILNPLCNFSNSIKKLRKSPFEIIDLKLFEWFKAQRQNNVTINSYVLSEKADQIAKEEKVNNFRCNPSWIERFKNRYYFTL